MGFRIIYWNIQMMQTNVTNSSRCKKCIVPLVCTYMNIVFILLYENTNILPAMKTFFLKKTSTFSRTVIKYS